jgi:hypothetical protein
LDKAGGEEKQMSIHDHDPEWYFGKRAVSGHRHFQVKCKVCGTCIAQCRCPNFGGQVDIREEVCESCQREPRNVPEIPQPEWSQIDHAKMRITDQRRMVARKIAYEMHREYVDGLKPIDLLELGSFLKAVIEMAAMNAMEVTGAFEKPPPPPNTERE